MCEAKERERERDQRAETKRAQRTREARRRSRFAQFLVSKVAHKQKKSLSSLFHLTQQNKKKQAHTSKGKNSISPPPLQKFIYTHRIKKTAYIKNGFYCASEKSLLVSHFLVRCERIERSRVFARGGFPIGFFLLSFSTRRDGLELSLPA